MELAGKMPHGVRTGPAAAESAATATSGASLLAASPGAAVQRELMSAIQAGPRALAQRRAADGLRRSPAQVAQRQRLGATFGTRAAQGPGVVQRQYVPDASLGMIAGTFNQDTSIFNMQGQKQFAADRGTRQRFTRIGPHTVYFMIGGEEHYASKDSVTLDAFEAVDQPLFQKDEVPRPQDVRQGSLGDCFLLAVAGSIAQANPGYIRNMMTDKGRTVSVRFFHVAQGPGGDDDRTFTPVHVEVDKSVVKTAGGDEPFARGALWVRILEKAYVASGIDPNSELLKSRGSLSFDAFDEGGTASFAFQVFLGGVGKQVPIFSGYDRSDDDVLPWSSAERQAYKESRLTDMKSHVILNGDAALIQTWIDFISHQDANGEGPIERMLNGRTEFKDLARKDPYYDGEIRIEHFEKMFAVEKLDATVAQAMVRWLKSSGYYPGKRAKAHANKPGEAQYSDVQLEAYEHIRQGLADQQPIALKSKDVPLRSTKKEGSGGAGEVKGKGFLGGHYYMIVDCDTDAASGFPTVSNVNLHWVKVRNPWGHYGVEYDLKNNQLVRYKIEAGNGEFWLELSDITKYFKTVHIGAKPQVQ